MVIPAARLLVALTATPVLAGADASADRSVRVYGARQRPGAELRSLARVALGDQGSASVDEGTSTWC